MHKIAMIILIVLFIPALASAGGMVVPGAADNAIRHDCIVTSQMTIALMKMRFKNSPEQIFDAARTMLTEKGYKGSFGDAGFIAEFYTGMALQTDPEIDKALSEANQDEINGMIQEMDINCLKSAFAEQEKSPEKQPEPGASSQTGR